MNKFCTSHRNVYRYDVHRLWINTRQQDKCSYIHENPSTIKSLQDNLSSFLTSPHNKSYKYYDKFYISYLLLPPIYTHQPSKNPYNRLNFSRDNQESCRLGS